MRSRWVWIIALGLIAGSPARAQQILQLGPNEPAWLDMPVLQQDPNTLQIPSGVRIPQVLSGWQTRDCPSGAYLHMKRWVCIDWYATVLASPGRYYGKTIRTQGVIRMAPGGDIMLMPSTDITKGPDGIRVDAAASSLLTLRDGEPVFIAGTLKPEDTAHAPSLGVLFNVHDVVFSEYPAPEALLPSLQLKAPKPVADTPPKFDVAPQGQSGR